MAASRPEHAASATRADHLGDFTVTRRVLLLLGLAVVIGAASAVVAFALLRLIGLATNLFFHFRLDTALTAPDSPHRLVILGVPVLGGLIVGLLARFGSEKIRGHGMPEAIESILTGGSRVQPRVAILKPLSAAISIGSGGPFGAEGPIIMTGGAVGSVLAQHLKLTADERKILLVTGAAGGMAATFNAPLAAVLLAVELLLFEWRPRSFLPVATGVATATVARYALLGSAPIFGVPAVHLHLDPGVYLLFVVAGCVGGVMRSPLTGVVFSLELTHEWSALLPLAIAATAGYGLSALVLKRSVLTEKIARRGHHLTREYSIDPLEIMFIREVMSTEVVTLRVDSPLSAVTATFLSPEHVQVRDRQHRQRLYPVLDAEDRLVGVATRRDLLDAALNPPQSGTVRDIMVADPVVALPDETLREVANRLATSGVTRIPVVDRTDASRLLGVVSVGQLLRARLVDVREDQHTERILRLPRRRTAPAEAVAG
jgi:H+/Cl- antiporter ClcA